MHTTVSESMLITSGNGNRHSINQVKLGCSIALRHNKECLNVLKNYNFQTSLFLMLHLLLQKSFLCLSSTFHLLLHMRKYIKQPCSSKKGTKRKSSLGLK